MKFLKRIIAKAYVWWKRIMLPNPLPSTPTMSKTDLAQSFTSQLTWEEEDVIVLKEVPFKPSSS